MYGHQADETVATYAKRVSQAHYRLKAVIIR